MASDVETPQNMTNKGIRNMWWGVRRTKKKKKKGKLICRKIVYSHPVLLHPIQ